MDEPDLVNQQDERDLRRFGYLQQLQRSMGAFSSFAISFSLISITTGILGTFKVGIEAVGTAVVWPWIVAAFGQFLVALMVADLSARYPVSGYGYQWASRIINPHVGFTVGWCLMLQFFLGLPAICATLSVYVCGYFGIAESFQPLMTVGVLSVTAIVHLIGIRGVSLVNDVGVIAEIVGSILIALGLLVLWAWTRDTPVSVVFDTTNSATGLPATLPAFASALLVGAWCITGFEGASDLAEETHDPRRTVPKAVITSEVSSGIGGLIMLLAFVLSISKLAEAQNAKYPILFIIEQKMGSIVMPWVMTVIYVSIFACGIASMAALTRLMFALARDNMIPASNALRSIDPKTHSPRASILLVWVVSSVAVLILKDVGTLASVATVAAYLGYSGIVVSGLLQPAPKVETRGIFSLGRWRPFVGIAALGWLATAIPSLILTDSASGYLVGKTALLALSVGVLVYFLYTFGQLRLGNAGPPRETDIIPTSEEEIHAS